MEDKKELTPPTTRPKRWIYKGSIDRPPIIRFDGDPNVYQAHLLTPTQIERYVKETPNQGLFVQE